MILRKDNMKNYISKFNDWLCNDSTAKSYKSGMTQLVNWYNNNVVNEVKGNVKNFPGFFESLEQINDDDIVNTFFSFVRVQLHKKIIASSSKTTPTKETLYNWISYLNSFQEFWIESQLQQISNHTIANGVLDIFNKTSQDVTFSKDVLIKVFVSRLTSQDRISSSKKILFPIRLMNKIWKKDTQDWAKDYAENIYMIIKYKNNLKKIKIKDITSMNIKSGKGVSVKYNGETCIVYTSYSDPYEHLVVNPTKKELQYYRKRTPIIDMKASFHDSFEVDSKQNIIIDRKTIIWHVRPMVVAHLGEIAIDHDIPIALILEEKEKQLLGLEKITNIYKSISERNNLSVSQKNANNFSKLYSQDFQNEAANENVDFPSDDMDILKRCKLVLMQGDENGKKSDN